MSPKKRRIGIILFTVILLFGMTFYYKLVAKEIYEESSRYLLEIYNKMGNNFSMFIIGNRNIFNDWQSYSSEAPDAEAEAQIEPFIRKYKENWRFTEFYFLNEDGEYMTSDGKTGTITRYENLDSSEDKGDIDMFVATLSGEEDQIMFETPIIKGTYRGFEYEYVAISYSSKDVRDMLGIESFDGADENYIVYADGAVEFSAQESSNITNLLSYLGTENRMRTSELNRLKEKLAGHEADIFKCNISGKTYYIACQPLLSQYGMLVGIIPMTSVNKNLGMVQRYTVVVTAGLFAPIILYIFTYIIKRNKKELRDKDLELDYREKILDMVTKSLDDIYIIFTRQFEVKYISPNIEKNIGIGRELIKENIFNLSQVASDNKCTMNGETLESIAEGDRLSISRQFMNVVTGEKRHYKEIIYHLSGKGNNDYIMILSDRTKEQRAAEQLKSALDSAKHANEAKSLFFNNMSHDIRTPMNAIMGCADLLEKNSGDEAKVKAYTAKIISSGKFLLELINDVLDMSKIESGKLNINIVSFNLSDLLKEISDIVLPQTKAKNQQFEIIVSKITSEQLLGDRVRLGQILINLLSNAVKYTQPGGKIVLNITGLKQENDKYRKIRFEVSDNGIGMTQEFLKVIYDPFVRAEEKAGSKSQGTGLGMAITKNLVDIMNGSISVKSEPEKGSTFAVEFSFRTEKNDNDREFWREYNINKMLVVDDDEDICKNIITVMEDTGVNVSYATDGEAAVKLVQQTSYDLILIDWEMPGIDGVETARRIRESGCSGILILIQGSLEWYDSGEQALNAGINGFMQKPFFKSVLCSKIKELSALNEQDSTVDEEMSISGMHFLVVEDYELNYEILQARLELEGATCEVAVNGKQAVDMFESSQPGHFDGILMDVQMPVMNGYEATSAIRAGVHPSAKTIPIIAMTANAFNEDIKKSKEAGMDAHISKPIDMKLLKETIVELKNNEEKNGT